MMAQCYKGQRQHRANVLHTKTGMCLTSKTKVNDLTPKQCKLCDASDVKFKKRPTEFLVLEGQVGFLWKERMGERG